MSNGAVHGAHSAAEAGPSHQEPPALPEAAAQPPAAASPPAAEEPLPSGWEMRYDVYGRR